MAVVAASEAAPAAHPNAIDQRRIERALRGRKRYRYVKPRVVSMADGYRIEAPCCSRNIDPEGGIVDVALLFHDSDERGWILFSRDHSKDLWVAHSLHETIHGAIDVIVADENREFWK
jgi:hypothetical protein